MARIRKTEPAVTVSAAAAAPARRKTATATQKPRLPAVTAAKVAIVESIEVPYSSAQDEIAALAYSYWVGRGCQGGSPEEDWLRAERELLQPAALA
jgi:hypothetical protein